jgi:glycosyltransferase involved in cell wall biosynthesis
VDNSSEGSVVNLSISAFFPAYNDQHTIEALVRTAAAELRKHTHDFEVIVVNDGSQDQSGQILNRLAKELKEMRVIHHSRNRGYGGALITGFQHARKDVIFYTDGDAQYDVREIHNLLIALRPDVDLVNGYKVRRADPWYRIWIGEAYRRIIRLLFNLQVRDVDCDFRLIRRAILDRVSLESHSGVICVEMMRKLQVAGCRTIEVPVSHWPRPYGSSQFFRPRHLARVCAGLMKVWWKLMFLPMVSVPKPPQDEADYEHTETERSSVR